MRGRAVRNRSAYGKALFSFCRTVAAFQTVGLISVKIRDGTYFQPAFLCFGIHLKVKTEGSREAHIATAKAQDAVGEFQL